MLLSNARVFRLLWIVAWLLTALLIAWLGQLVLAVAIPFDTDEADHALAAWDVATALSRFDMPLLVRSVVNQAFYPPLHSLVVAPFYLIFGAGYGISRLPSVLCFAGALIFLALATRRLLSNSPSAPLGATTALVLGFTSLEAIENSVLCMLELQGIMLFCGMLYLAASRRVEATRPLIALALLLGLTKYSFALVVFPGLCAAVFFELFGTRGFRAALISSARVGGALVLGMLLWALVTDRYALSRFIVGHPSSGPIFGEENLLYYPRAWYRGYFVAPTLSIAVLPFLALGIYQMWSHFAVKLALGVFFFSAVVFTLSTTNETRHFLIALPAVWFLVSAGVSVAADWLVCRLQRYGRREEWLMLPIGIAVFFLVSWSCDRMPTLREGLRRQFEGDRSYAVLQDFIATNVDLRAPIISNGFFDQFGLQAVRWRLAVQGRLHSSELALESYPYRDEGFKRARERKRHIDRAFIDPNFPKEPFTAVLNTDFYRSAVQLQNRRRSRYRGEEAEEFRNALVGLESKMLEAGDWRIVVWRLASKKAADEG